MPSTHGPTQSAYEQEVFDHINQLLILFDTAKPEPRLAVLNSVHEICHGMLNADLVSLRFFHQTIFHTLLRPRFVAVAAALSPGPP